MGRENGDAGAAAAPRKVCLVGAGSYGTAVARVVADNLHRLAGSGMFHPSLHFWARRAALADEMARTRENKQYLPGSELPANLLVSSDLAEVVDGCDVVVMGVPSHHISEEMMKTVSERAGGGQAGRTVHVVSLAKGIEYVGGELRLVTDDLRKGIRHPDKSFEFSVVMGANVADQMGRDEFAEATLGCGASSSDEADVLHAVFDDPDRFFVTLTKDVAGVECSGALKNVVSLAAGYIDGLGLGTNAKAAVIRCGLKEIIKFAKINFDGVEDNTFLESSGVADLMVTCLGGRGCRLAAAFVKSKGAKDWATLEKEMLNGQQIPDWHNAQHVYHFLDAKNRLESFPLLSAVYEIGFKGHNPNEIVDSLKVRSGGIK